MVESSRYMQVQKNVRWWNAVIVKYTQAPPYHFLSWPGLMDGCWFFFFLLFSFTKSQSWGVQGTNCQQVSLNMDLSFGLVRLHLPCRDRTASVTQCPVDNSALITRALSAA